MLVNFTPHPITVYGWHVPNAFDPKDHEPEAVIPTSGHVARIGEIDLGSANLLHCDVPTEMVQYGHVLELPEPAPNTWLVVSLALALTRLERGDLLVPWREVRNLAGSVIGCRALALPV